MRCHKVARALQRSHAVVVDPGPQPSLHTHTNGGQVGCIRGTAGRESWVSSFVACALGGETRSDPRHCVSSCTSYSIEASSRYASINVVGFPRNLLNEQRYGLHHTTRHCIFVSASGLASSPALDRRPPWS